MTDYAHNGSLQKASSNRHATFDARVRTRIGEIYLGVMCRLLRCRPGSRWIDPYIYGSGLFPRSVVREVTRFGYRMRLDLHDQIGRMIYFLGSHEPAESQYVASLIRPDWVVVDVGAQIGYYTLMAARNVDAQRGHVYAIEPNPSSLEELRYHVWANDLPHVTIIPNAVGRADGAAEFYPGPAHNTGLASRFDRGYDNPPVRVEQTSIDQLAEKYGWWRLDFLKVDAEGCEAAVLAGASETIARFKPLLLLELNEHMLRLAGSSFADVVRRLRALGYSIRESGVDHRELTDEQICARRFLNVFAVHES